MRVGREVGGQMADSRGPTSSEPGFLDPPAVVVRRGVRARGVSALRGPSIGCCSLRGDWDGLLMGRILDARGPPSWAWGLVNSLSISHFNGLWCPRGEAERLLPQCNERLIREDHVTLRKSYTSKKITRNLQDEMCQKNGAGHRDSLTGTTHKTVLYGFLGKAGNKSLLFGDIAPLMQEKILSAVTHAVGDEEAADVNANEQPEAPKLVLQSLFSLIRGEVEQLDSRTLPLCLHQIGQLLSLQELKQDLIHLRTLDADLCDTDEKAKAHKIICIEVESSDNNGNHCGKLIEFLQKTCVSFCSVIVRAYEKAMKFIQLERLYHEQLLANLSAIQEQWETKWKTVQPHTVTPLRNSEKGFNGEDFERLTKICATHRDPLLSKHKIAVVEKSPERKRSTQLTVSEDPKETGATTKVSDLILLLMYISRLHVPGPEGPVSDEEVSGVSDELPFSDMMRMLMLMMMMVVVVMVVVLSFYVRNHSKMNFITILKEEK
ncbi:hypothetical protein P7K49_035326 [Saguinus oedipus]|uniref:Consortin N-terminal domain-containing protein n=1 Tax=Saguinus oedipus TaxID=9490 RepID=A0ABQ9TMC7_SAGOE|nr:hypothetical protein P7K49_035326 [Saguinus oedipus]